MFYSKYSSYSDEQMLTEDYKKHCEMLLSMTTDENVRKKMKRNII